MTLIIAKASPTNIYILGDTALTFYNGQPTNPVVSGCLKQYIVSDSLAIAFSGEQSHWELICGKILACQRHQDLVDIAQRAQLDGLDFDLLVAEVGLEQITFIKNSTITRSSAGFIGNKYAFEAFQHYYHNEGDNDDFNGGFHADAAFMQFIRIPEPIPNNNIYSRTFDSLKRVMSSQQYSDVGGLIISVCSDNGSFRYMNYADVISGPLNHNDFDETPKPINFGTVENGGCAIEFIDGGTKENIGAYFLQGGFGVIFPKNENGIRSARLVKAKNPAYWELETKKIFGEGMRSSYLCDDHCGMAGEALLHNEQFEDATFCYELRKDSKELRARLGVFDRFIAGYATSLANSDKRQAAIDILETELRLNPDLSICSDILRQILI